MKRCLIWILMITLSLPFHCYAGQWINPKDIIGDPMIARLQGGRAELNGLEKREVEKYGFTGLEITTYLDSNLWPGKDNDSFYRLIQATSRGHITVTLWMRRDKHYFKDNRAIITFDGIKPGDVKKRERHYHITPLHVATDKIEGRPVYYKRYKDIGFPQKKEGEKMSKTKVSGCCGSGPQTNQEEADKIREEVKRHYASLASQEKAGSSCCGPTNKNLEELGKGKFAKWAGYTEEDLSQIPQEASEYSFGCGNPLAYTEVRPGEVVLDLGSGAGIDVFLAAKKVGKTGKIIGLDMTPEMIDKAQKNAKQAGLDNVEFRLGVMEDIPVEDDILQRLLNCDLFINL